MAANLPLPLPHMKNVGKHLGHIAPLKGGNVAIKFKRHFKCFKKHFKCLEHFLHIYEEFVYTCPQTFEMFCFGVFTLLSFKVLSIEFNGNRFTSILLLGFQ